MSALVWCQLCGERLKGWMDSRAVNGVVACRDMVACKARREKPVAKEAGPPVSDVWERYHCPLCERERTTRCQVHIERKPEGGGRIRCIR